MTEFRGRSEAQSSGVIQRALDDLTAPSSQALSPTKPANLSSASTRPRMPVRRRFRGSPRCSAGIGSSPASKGRECSAQTKATYRRPDVKRLAHQRCEWIGGPLTSDFYTHNLDYLGSRITDHLPHHPASNSIRFTPLPMEVEGWR